jgi:Leucine-rich repeat (LRR) protein
VSLFANLPALTQILLVDTGLTTLPLGIFDATPALQYILLSGSPLLSLPAGIFDKLPVLSSVNVASTKLSTLPPCLFCANLALTSAQLSAAGLSSTPYTYLPAHLFPTTGSMLRTLYLEGAKLTSLNATVFANLSSLTNLRLENSGIVTLPPGIFDSLTKLQYKVNPNPTE